MIEISILVIAANLLTVNKTFSSEAQDVCILSSKSDLVCDKSVRAQKQVVAINISRQTKVINGLALVFTNCHRKDDNIACQFFIQDMMPERRVVFNSTEIVDKNDISYNAESCLLINGMGIFFGDTRDFLKSTIYRGEITFKGVPQQVKKLRLFRVNVNNINYDFRNILIAN